MNFIKNMSLTMGYQSLDIKGYGSTTTVPDNNLALLMYYLHCVFEVVEIKESGRLTDYKNYFKLSKAEEELVVSLALIFNAKVMTESSLFLVGSRYVPSGSSNHFYELGNNKIGIHINSQVIIGGVSRKVLRVMGCTESWLYRNYYTPILSYGTEYRNNKGCCESFCQKLDCLDRCFDFCCGCFGDCSPGCKKFCCIFMILYCIVGPIIAIIACSIH